MSIFQSVVVITLTHFLTQAPESITGNVVAVHQGDTFTIQSLPPNDNLYKVRLSNIDTPELTQPFGPQAKEYTETYILGENVEVKYNMVDLYGRLVGSVVLPKGGVLNEALVR